MIVLCKNYVKGKSRHGLFVRFLDFVEQWLFSFSHLWFWCWEWNHHVTRVQKYRMASGFSNIWLLLESPSDCFMSVQKGFLRVRVLCYSFFFLNFWTVALKFCNLNMANTPWAGKLVSYFLALMWTGLIGGFIFILLQLILIVDFVHSLAEEWMDKYEENESRACYCGNFIELWNVLRIFFSFTNWFLYLPCFAS